MTVTRWPLATRAWPAGWEGSRWPQEPCVLPWRLREAGGTASGTAGPAAARRGWGGSGCCGHAGFVAPGLCFQLHVSAVRLEFLFEQHHN